MQNLRIIKSLGPAICRTLCDKGREKNLGGGWGCISGNGQGNIKEQEMSALRFQIPESSHFSQTPNL